MSEQGKQQEQAVVKPSSHMILKIMVLLCFIIAIGALGASAFLWQQYQHSSQVQSLTKQQVSEIRQQLTVTDDAVDKQQESLTNQKSLIQRLSAETNERDRTLVLAETEYLTRLANFSLQFEHNVPQAIQLLQTANKRLQSLSDPTLMKIRGVITEDITKLQAVPAADIPGVLLKLNALGGEINQLPLQLTHNDENDTKVSDDKQKQSADTEHQPSKEAQTSPSSDDSNNNNAHTSSAKDQTKAKSQPSIWRRGWDKTWNTLKSIVVIKHGNSSKLIPPSERNYIDQHLQLLLAQAQWALIRHKQKLYSTSIKQAETWTKQYYAEDKQQTKAMLASLKKLSQLQIQPKLPDLSNSLELIRQTLNQNAGQMEQKSHDS